MALPTSSANLPSGVLARRMARQREQEARCRQQWELHSQYFKEHNIRCHKNSVWSSPECHQQSMSAYHKQRLKEEKSASLEQRRNRLRALLQEEQDQLEAELREVLPDRSTKKMRKTEELHSSREERRKKLAQELLKEHCRTNNPELRKVESTLHKDHVVGQSQEQISETKQEQEEKRHFESEYERTRKDAPKELEGAEEKNKAGVRERTEALCQQMEELKLREVEADCLKKEQDALLAQHWELEKIKEERRKLEEKINKSNIGHFLIRQYRSQLKRKAQQVQEELEADRTILAALLEREKEDKRVDSAQMERAVDDTAWMKHVIEEQIQLEREREAEFDMLYRDDAQRIWQKRMAEWEKERNARARLMHKVVVGRQQQLALKVQHNRDAQKECLRRREVLIQELERERETRLQERKQEEGNRTAGMQEMIRLREEEREAPQIQEELRLETEKMAKQGFQEKIPSRARSAWI